MELDFPTVPPSASRRFGHGKPSTVKPRGKDLACLEALGLPACLSRVPVFSWAHALRGHLRRAPLGSSFATEESSFKSGFGRPKGSTHMIGRVSQFRLVFLLSVAFASCFVSREAKGKPVNAIFGGVAVPSERLFSSKLKASGKSPGAGDSGSSVSGRQGMSCHGKKAMEKRVLVLFAQEPDVT